MSYLGSRRITAIHLTCLLLALEILNPSVHTSSVRLDFRQARSQLFRTRLRVLQLPVVRKVSQHRGFFAFSRCLMFIYIRDRAVQMYIIILNLGLIAVIQSSGNKR